MNILTIHSITFNQDQSNYNISADLIVPSLLSNSNIYHLSASNYSTPNQQPAINFSSSPSCSPYSLATPIPIYMPTQPPKYATYTKLDTISSLLNQQNQQQNTTEFHIDSNDSANNSFQDYNIYSSLSPVSSISALSSLSGSPLKSIDLGSTHDNSAVKSSDCNSAGFTLLIDNFQVQNAAANGISSRFENEPATTGRSGQQRMTVSSCLNEFKNNFTSKPDTIQTQVKHVN